MDHLLEIQQLSKFYGKFLALDRLDLTVKKGQIIGFLGPNGSGKTTTIKIIGGLLTQYSGKVIYKNKESKHIGNKKECKFVFDNQNFYENLTAYENLIIISRLNHNFNRKKMLSALEKIGLGGWENIPVKKFSRGMKQRLAIASSELIIPEFLVLDEPTNGLDIQGISSLESYFKDLNKNYGTTILLSSHYLEQVQRLSDHIVIIYKGKKIFDGDYTDFSKESRIGVRYVFRDNIASSGTENLEKTIKNDTVIRNLGLSVNKVNLSGSVLDVFMDNFAFSEDKQCVLNRQITTIIDSNPIIFIYPLEKELKDFFREEVSTQNN